MQPIWEQTDPQARLTERGQVQPPRETTFPAAQEQANFVVFVPTWLPADCALSAVSLRPEQPPGRPGGVTPEEMGQTPWSSANPCSVRAIVAGRGRRLRLKQFLYDWAPPAASTAPLWNSPQLTPILCQGAVAWQGTDYMGRRGACVQLLRTQIEVSIEDHLWLLAVNRDSALAPSLPPRLSTHPAALRTATSLRSTTIHYAALDEQYGAWEAFWEEGDTRYALWAGSSQLLDGARFHTLVASLQVT